MIIYVEKNTNCRKLPINYPKIIYVKTIKENRKMKKIYMKPETAKETVKMSMGILAASGGVTTGSTPGNEYNSDDVTYGNEGGSLWDEE